MTVTARHNLTASVSGMWWARGACVRLAGATGAGGDGFRGVFQDRARVHEEGARPKRALSSGAGAAGPGEGECAPPPLRHPRARPLAQNGTATSTARSDCGRGEPAEAPAPPAPQFFLPFVLVRPTGDEPPALR